MRLRKKIPVNFPKIELLRDETLNEKNDKDVETTTQVIISTTTKTIISTTNDEITKESSTKISNDESEKDSMPIPETHYARWFFGKTFFFSQLLIKSFKIKIHVK